ncbi:substrate-binding periplasmic protein [Pseudomonas sp. Gutcm_11s]|uniref:substrate-binding periplasmic protein n=1 Tax=Pseudomonas sp. Gutcm_11s TaxID=3026088 RepID=UPI00235FC504|nr:ABC transporter substrate-binding protein [Pseudomonas sp. Gutcm_11s]MDD0842792.1 ABC transporter substrate-binding protein [Pseudomonas sp. Gutcm_11s]
MMIRLLLPLVAGLLFAGVASAAQVRLVTGDDYAPFTGQSLPAGGMLTELVQRTLQQAGHQTSLAWLPWKRGYRAALKGQFDATYPYLASGEREADYLFSTPLYVTTRHLFSRAGDAWEPDDSARLMGKRMCLPLGWQPPASFARLLEAGQLHLHEPQDLTACARLVEMGRDDFFIADSLLGERAIFLSGTGSASFNISRGSVGSSSLHLLVPRNRSDAQQLIDQFDSALRQLQESGEYARIIEAHRKHALSGR